MSINKRIGFCERVLDHCTEQVGKVKNKCTNVIDKHKISASLKIYDEIIKDVVAQTIDLGTLKNLNSYDITVVNKIVEKVSWGKKVPLQIKTTLVYGIIQEYNIAHFANKDDISKSIKAAFPEYSNKTRSEMCEKINDNLAVVRRDFEKRRNPPLSAEEKDPFLSQQKNHKKIQANIDRVDKKIKKPTSFFSGQQATTIQSSLSLAQRLLKNSVKVG